MNDEGGRMSLFIDVDRVREVLLGGTWHTVFWTYDESTFTMDSYEYVDADTFEHYDRKGGEGFGRNPGVLLGGGEYESCGIPALGFGFKDCAHVGAEVPNTPGKWIDTPGRWIFGPVTSIQAVVVLTDEDVERRKRVLDAAV